MQHSHARDAHMDPQVITAISAALVSVLMAVGGAIKWLLSRMDSKDTADREAQARERNILVADFQARISAMQAVLDRQAEQIDMLRGDLTKYVRHVGVLEGLLKANGIEVPQIVEDV